MRKSKIIQFRVEECVNVALQKVAKGRDSTVTNLVYSGVLLVLKKNMKKGFEKLEAEIEKSVSLNEKVGRKPRQNGKKPAAAKKPVAVKETPKKAVKKKKKLLLLGGPFSVV